MYWTDSYHQGNDRLNGKADEVEFFNRALSDTEIAAIYNAGSAGKCRSCTAPPSGTVSWWGGDNNALDMIGGNNGTLINGTTYASGIVGQAFSFDGVNDYVSIPDADFRSNAACTMAFWVQTTDAGDPIVFGDNGPLKGALFGRGNQVNQHLHLGIASGKQTLEWYESGHHSIQGTSNIADGHWHHLAFVSDGAGTASLYVDGVFEKSDTFIHTSGSSSTRFGSQYEGNDGLYSYYYDGLIDEVEFFSRALSAQEIADIAKATNKGSCRSCTLPPNNMVSWWKGEDGTIDSIGANDGTLTGGTYASGKVGEAFSFDGIDDYVSVPASSNWAFGTGDFTVEFWANGAFNNTFRPIINNRKTPASDSMWAIEIYDVANRVEFHSGLTIFLTATNQLISSSWNHIAVTRNGTMLSMYINGVLSGSVSNSSDFSEINDLQIGRDIMSGNQLGGGFQGLIDEVSIFNRALSADEVAAIYNAGSAGVCATSYAITVNSPLGSGSVSCPGSILQGYPLLCTITPSAGYYLFSLTDNSVDVLGSVSGGIYALTNVSEAHTLEVTFARYPVWRNGTTGYFMTIGEAYGGGMTAYTIKAHGVELVDSNLNLAGTAGMIIDGGYLPDFSGYSGTPTTITGPLTIGGSGVVTVSNIAVK